MKSGMSWQDLLELVVNATGETIYMVVVATFFTVLIGLPLGSYYLFRALMGCYRLPA